MKNLSKILVIGLLAVAGVFYLFNYTKADQWLIQGSVKITGYTSNTPLYPNDKYYFTRTLTIDHTKIASTTSETYPNFAVLVSTTTPLLATTDYGGHVISHFGNDIKFSTSSTGSTFLPAEMEKYDPTTGQVLAWVNVGAGGISTSSDTTLYMFYGNRAQINAPTNTTSVWDTNYKGVWHLPDGTGLTANDSTSNANNGTVNGATATTGQVDGAANFNGSTQYINVPDSTSLGVPTFTVSAWVNTPTVNSTFYQIVNRFNTVSGRFDFELRLANNNKFQVIASNGTTDSFQYSNVVSTNTWYFVAATYDGNGNLMYVNGANQTNGGTNVSLTPPHTAAPTSIGRISNNLQYWPGKIDEVRISSVVRSADWIKTEYNNQNSPGTFITWGVEANN